MERCAAEARAPARKQRNRRRHERHGKRTSGVGESSHGDPVKDGKRGRRRLFGRRGGKGPAQKAGAEAAAGEGPGPDAAPPEAVPVASFAAHPFDNVGEPEAAPPAEDVPASAWFEGVELSSPPGATGVSPAPEATQPLPAIVAAGGGEVLDAEAAGRSTGAAGAGADEEAGPLKTVSIADLAKAHQQASVEQAIAEDLARRAERRKKVLITVALAIVGVLIGSGAALLAVARERRTGGAEPKVGISGGVLPSASPTAGPSVEPTGSQLAQVVVVILGAGDGSNETSANLARFTRERYALTYAVLPQRAGTGNDAAAIQASGGQPIVYQPIGGKGSSVQKARGGAEPGQSRRQFANTLIRNLAGMPGAAGFAPYGFAPSRFPTEAVRLVPAIAVRQSAFLFQIHEGTQTPMAERAKALGARFLAADQRLDKKPGEKYFRGQWEAALKRAERDRRVVVVCRLNGLTARVLPALLAALDTTKFQLSLASALAADPSQPGQPSQTSPSTTTGQGG